MEANRKMMLLIENEEYETKLAKLQRKKITSEQINQLSVYIQSPASRKLTENPRASHCKSRRVSQWLINKLFAESTKMTLNPGTVDQLQHPKSYAITISEQAR
jgi:hypothetical protein